jgi:acyl carrier protein phosphodiesterase
MGRGLNAFVIDILRPPALAIGFVIRKTYWLFYGWWGEPRFEAKERERLAKEIQDKFGFLFEQFDAQIVPNTDIGHFAALHCPIVTVSCSDLLFRFIRWHDNHQVHVAAERVPIEWQELSELVSAIEPSEPRRGSILSFDDAAHVLKDHFNRIKEAFTQEHYPGVKQQIAQTHDYERAVAEQWEKEINRRIYR